MNVEVIKFNEKEIQVVRDDQAQPLVAMKPICEALGVEWKRHHQVIMKDVVLSSVITRKVITAADGKQYETICLPLDYLNGWLFKIDARRYQGERRELIIRYQKECYRVLAEHFLGRQPGQPESSAPVPADLADAMQRQMLRAVEQAALDDTAALRYELWQFVRNHKITELGELIALATEVMARVATGAQFVPAFSGPERWRFGRPHPCSVRRCLERAVSRLS